MPTQKYRKIYYYLSVITLCFSLQNPHPAHAAYNYSPAMSGFLGLNNAPNTRMDKVGTIRAGVSTLDPYMHGYIGIQIATPLYINFRQSAEISSLNQDAKHLYPGIDLKLRLLKETSHLPEISLGLQSAIGHKKMASEYIALSKRYNNFDISAGIGWGRLGSAKHLNNPLRSISKHFSKNRDQNSETPNNASNWFSGDSIALFAGLEYFTPLDGLSLKLDYNSDKYTSERANFNYTAPAPWSAGLSYNYHNWAGASIATQGFDKIMGRISLQSNADKWWFKGKKYNNPKPFYKNRPPALNLKAIKYSAANDDIYLSNISAHGKSIFATLEISPDSPAPQQIGRALRHISENSGYNIEEINITPISKNLKGAEIKIIRSDVEKAMDKNNSSPQEIWNNTKFVVSDKNKITHSRFMPIKGINNLKSFKFSLENLISLSEEDSGTLYRSSAVIEQQTNPFLGFVTGYKFRVNINDNLENIDKLRPTALKPVHSDINAFTNSLINLDNAYISYITTPKPNLYAGVTAGYLDEFYYGIGGEILYRPFASRLALGAEIWKLNRRDPYSPLNLATIDGNSPTSGHINAWYDLPKEDITLKLRAGRYLASDIGGSIGLIKTFKNGVKLDTSLSITNYSDPDIFGGTTSAYHEINLTLPLGSIPHINQGSNIKTTIAPFARDIGQSINPPINLYETSNNLTLNHMAKYWNEILD